MNNINFSKTFFLLSIFLFPYTTYLVEIGLPPISTNVVRLITILFGIISFYRYKIIINKELFFFIFFMILYYSSFLKDVFILNYNFAKPPIEIFLFALAIHIIPVFAFLNQNILKGLSFLEKNLFFGFNILCLLAIVFNNSVGGRLAGNKILNPITVGQISSSALIINFIIFKSKRKVIKNSLLFIFSLISITCLILSSSRGPMLSLLFPIMLYFYFDRKIKISFKNLFGIIFFSIIIFYLIGMADSFDFNFLNRMKISSEEGKEEERIILYLLGWEQITRYPLLGSHVTTYTNGYLHNFILEILMGTGIIGLLCFLIPYFKILRNIKFQLKFGSTTMKILALLFIQYSIAVLFSGMVFDNDIFWILFPILLSTNVSKITTQNSN